MRVTLLTPLTLPAAAPAAKLSVVSELTITPLTLLTSRPKPNGFAKRSADVGASTKCAVGGVATRRNFDPKGRLAQICFAKAERDGGGFTREARADRAQIHAHEAGVLGGEHTAALGACQLTARDFEPGRRVGWFHETDVHVLGAERQLSRRSDAPWSIH